MKDFNEVSIPYESWNSFWASWIDSVNSYTENKEMNYVKADLEDMA